jgi:CRP-like cAMP-binding protein
MRDSPSFAGVNAEILVELAKSASDRFFGEGEKAISQGIYTDEFYEIVRGKAEVTLNQENSARDLAITQLAPGDFFGESALSGKGISSVTVTALSDLELLVIPIDNMQIALEQSTGLRQEIGAVMESRRKAIALLKKTQDKSLTNGNGKYFNS